MTLLTIYIIMYICTMKLNRIKVVLAEKDKTQTDLSAYFDGLKKGNNDKEARSKGRVSISRWCSNIAQPSLSDLKRVADFLNVPLRELIVDYKPETGVKK